jgi:hypothetical protein
VSVPLPTFIESTLLVGGCGLQGMNMTAFPLEELAVMAFIQDEKHGTNKSKREWFHEKWKEKRKIEGTY